MSKKLFDINEKDLYFPLPIFSYTKFYNSDHKYTVYYAEHCKI